MRLYWTNFKPFWSELTNNYLRQNIEEYLADNGYIWNEFNNNAFNWTEAGIELTTERDDINYLKLIDNNGVIWYFYKNVIPYNPKGSSNVNIRNYTYAYDLYNTIFREIFLFFESQNVPIFAVKGFLDRFELSVNNAIVSANFNLTRMKYMAQVIPDNYHMIKRFITATNPTEMAELNNTPSNFEFLDFADLGTNFNFTNNQLNIPNSNNRFTYLKANATSFYANVDTTKANLFGMDYLTNYDFLYIIPNYTLPNPSNTFYSPELCYKFLYPNEIQLTKLDVDFTNPAGNNFIGIYDRDIPYSVICSKYLNALRFARIRLYDRGDGNDDRIDKTYDDNFIIIPFILVKINQAIDIKIYQYKQLSSSIFGKLINAIQNIDKWTPETEPFLLNPFFYREEMLIDAEKKLTLDSGLIELYVENVFNIKEEDYYLNGKIIFDSAGILIYDFGNNTNRLNVWWNNYFTNCRFDDSNQIGYKTSSLANYASDNVTALYTAQANLKDSIANRNWNASMDISSLWTNYGFNTAKDVLGTISSTAKAASLWGLFTNEPIRSGVDIAVTGVNIAQGAFNTSMETAKIHGNVEYQNKQQIRQYTSQVKTVTSGAPQNVSQPFLTSYYRNEPHDNNYLFATYSNELHPIDKLNIFDDILKTGYNINTFVTLSELRNRKYMNYYLLDYSQNINYLWQVFQKFNSYNNYFNNNYWFQLFTTYFNSVKIWEQNIVNCENYGHIENNTSIAKNQDYIDNYELKLDIYFQHNLANTDLNNLDLTDYYFFNKPLEYCIAFLKTLTTFTDFKYINIQITNNSVIFRGDSVNYVGSLVKNTRETKNITNEYFYNIVDKNKINESYFTGNEFTLAMLDDVSVKKCLGFILESSNNADLWEEIKDFITIDDYLLHSDYTLSGNFHNFYIQTYTQTSNTSIGPFKSPYVWAKFDINYTLNNNDFTKPSYLIYRGEYNRIIISENLLYTDTVSTIYRPGLFDQPAYSTGITLFSRGHYRFYNVNDNGNNYLWLEIIGDSNNNISYNTNIDICYNTATYNRYFAIGGVYYHNLYGPLELTTKTYQLTPNITIINKTLRCFREEGNQRNITIDLFGSTKDKLTQAYINFYNNVIIYFPDDPGTDDYMYLQYIVTK